jgi:hypothetical protein
MNAQKEDLLLDEKRFPLSLNFIKTLQRKRICENRGE